MSLRFLDSHLIKYSVVCLQNRISIATLHRSFSVKDYGQIFPSMSRYTYVVSATKNLRETVLNKRIRHSGAV